MADSKRQLIVAAVGARLAEITTLNGYDTNLGAHVFAWRPLENQLLGKEELPAVIYCDIAAHPVDDGTIGAFRWMLDMQLDIYLADGANTATTARKCLSDIYRALGKDILWSGLANTTHQPEDELEINQEENIVGHVTVRFSITYDAALWRM